jgi:hypothetical protein
MRKVIDLFISLASIQWLVASVNIRAYAAGLGPGGDFLNALDRAAHLNQWAALRLARPALMPFAARVFRER